jgi:hypothetical protein
MMIWIGAVIVFYTDEKNTAATIVPRFDSEGGIEPEVRNMDISDADKQGQNIA